MTQLLPFKLGEEIYALELTDIQEVVEGQRVFDFPGSPEQILGAIVFHGRILPVVDLPLLLGFGAGERAERLLVLVDDHGPVILAVDQLQPIFSVDLGQETLTQSSSEADCIRGVLSWGDRMISLFDLAQLQSNLEQLCCKTGG